MEGHLLRAWALRVAPGSSQKQQGTRRGRTHGRARGHNTHTTHMRETDAGAHRIGLWVRTVEEATNQNACVYCTQTPTATDDRSKNGGQRGTRGQRRPKGRRRLDPKQTRQTHARAQHTAHKHTIRIARNAIEARKAVAHTRAQARTMEKAGATANQQNTRARACAPAHANRQRVNGGPVGGCPRPSTTTTPAYAHCAPADIRRQPTKRTDPPQAWPLVHAAPHVRARAPSQLSGRCPWSAWNTALRGPRGVHACRRARGLNTGARYA
mmetsp:Transcript_53282/g.87581  ORF Transcript_53282/g.87581 Transcript_53282/m.87581 type:complete len:268 (+) Transcript_53282:1463-2266(+)